jgi:predicted PurR-regulated permease PerM
MHPLEALITIYAGIKLFGVTGVITFPILWVLIKAAWKTKIFFK